MERIYTVVLADDDALLRSALTATLSANKRVKVWEASNGKDALIFAVEKHPDLLILDVAMPGLDGISVLRQLRADAWGAEAKVILLTSLGGSDAVMEEVGKLNPAHCLIKDKVSLDEVAEKAFRLLDISK